MSATIKKQLTFEMSAEELADAFLEMTSDGQADFLGFVAEKMRTWSSHERQMQTLYIAKDLRGVVVAEEFLRDLVEGLSP